MGRGSGLFPVGCLGLKERMCVSNEAITDSGCNSEHKHPNL